MIGSVIAKIRKDKNISKTDLSKITNVDIGHLTHIEKEERNPSHKTLKAICNALEVPVQPIMYTYDHELTEEQNGYNVFNHIKYDSIPVFGSLDGFFKCPKEFSNVTFAVKNYDISMIPKIKVGEVVFIQCNAPLTNRDFGLFEYNGNYIFRRFIVRKKDLVLRAEDNSIEDIVLTKDSKFNILGKVVGTSDPLMSKYVAF